MTTQTDTKTPEQIAEEAEKLAAQKAAVEAEEAARKAKEVADEEERKAREKQNLSQGDNDIVKKVVEERVAEELKEIKAKLDKAYALRDAAEAKASQLEAKQRETEIARLKEEGKFKEAYEIEKAELQAKLDRLQKQNTELSRDSTVRAALSGLEFRNEKAASIAFRDIVEQLMQNESGVWIHRSGVSIADFISVYSKEEAQSFLFKTKASTGAGTTAQTGRGNSSTSNSLFSKSQEEVLAMAAAGQFNK